MRVLDIAARQRTITSLRQLWSPDGYAERPGGAADPGATLSVVKALTFVGSRPEDPDAVRAAVLRWCDPDRAVWTDPGTGAPSVLATAAGLIALTSIGAREELRVRLSDGLDWMAEQARSREDHFMAIAVADECGAPAPPGRSVAYFRSLEQPDGTFGPSALQNGIAASALVRAGEALSDPRAVTRLIEAARTTSGGYADDGQVPHLWTSYCCLRALDLLGVDPDSGATAEWVLGMSLDDGGFGTDGVLSAGTTYQCLSILDWVLTPVVDAARRGDASAVRRYLGAGTDPDTRDLAGWTPLAAAAVNGRAEVVRLLLTGDGTGGWAADPDARVAEADALPIFWAGQSGDLDTVQALLAHRPEHVFETSSVNGHTVLLQAVFFGTARHVGLVTWLLDHIGDVLGLDPTDEAGLRAARHRLMLACNTRGYTATAMARLWNNEALIKILSDADDTTPAEVEHYYQELLASIAEPTPRDAAQRAAQELADELVATITRGFHELDEAVSGAGSDVEAAEAALRARVSHLIEDPSCDVNRQGGPLGQTPVIAAVTGTDADPRVAAARLRLTSLLLRHGANPDLPERHPMAVDAVIRACVLNHFECVQEIARHLGPLTFAAAVNERPAINGQTALDDTVHRALTAPDATVQSHLDQIRWIIQHGGRSDIPDFTGTTVADRAQHALTDPVLGGRAADVLAALNLSDAQSRAPATPALTR